MRAVRVGWVERSDTHHYRKTMGIGASASTHPTR